ncbi:MAG: iron-containing alcohol dehydrogenase, partial [Spirochaetes bacterium]|nr:iron-containing alcohol dehydrogenase [Spirochaetota bacterium]
MKNYKKAVSVNLKKKIDDSYPIMISNGINLAAEIKKLQLFNNYAIITDDKVYNLYKDKINEEFNKENLNFKFIVFKNGEKNKNLKVFSLISEKLLKLNFDRKSTVITLGGGVAGDMGGYTAGTFMRGVPFIQIPTTLLSMVDSSIGGKVA